MPSAVLTTAAQLRQDARSRRALLLGDRWIAGMLTAVVGGMATGLPWLIVDTPPAFNWLAFSLTSLLGCGLGWLLLTLHEHQLDLALAELRPGVRRNLLDGGLLALELDGELTSSTQPTGVVGKLTKAKPAPRVIERVRVLAREYPSHSRAARLPLPPEPVPWASALVIAGILLGPGGFFAGALTGHPGIGAVCTAAGALLVMLPHALWPERFDYHALLHVAAALELAEALEGKPAEE